MKVQFAKPLHNIAFLKLLLSQIISNSAKWLDSIALYALLIYVFKSGVASIATLTILVALPLVFVSPLSGVMIDRWPLRKAMFWSCLLRVFPTVALIFVPNTTVLLGLVFIRSILGSIFGPAEVSIIKKIFAVKDYLMKANSLRVMVQQGTRIIAPATGGIILLFWRPRIIFIITSICFLVSSIILYYLPNQLDAKISRSLDKTSSFVRELFDGFRVIWQSADMTLGIVAIGLGFASFLIANTLMPLLLKDIGMKASALGFVVTMIGLGGLVGGALIGQFCSKVSSLRLIAIGLCCIGVFFALLTFSKVVPYLFFYAIWFGVGLGTACVNVAYSSLMQTAIESEYLGRVAATTNFVQGIAMLAAPSLGAFLATIIHVEGAFFISGIGLVVVALLIFILQPALRKKPA